MATKWNILILTCGTVVSEGDLRALTTMELTWHTFWNEAALERIITEAGIEQVEVIAGS